MLGLLEKPNNRSGLAVAWATLGEWKHNKYHVYFIDRHLIGLGLLDITEDAELFLSGNRWAYS